MSNDNGTMKLDIATGKFRDAKTWRNVQMSWDELVKKCGSTHRTPETVKEYLAAPKTRQSEIKDVGGFVGGYLAGGRRKKDTVNHRQLVTLDADYADKTFWEDFAMLNGYTALCYSTHKHTPDNPRLRLVIPLDRPVSSAEYEPICRRIAADLGIEQFDHTTYDVHRLMYWPSTSRDGEFFFEVQEGDLLEADAVLGTYHNWQDASSWPLGDRETKAIAHGIKKQGDPLEKEGVVGAFCRVYGIEEAIETFLSDAYEKCDVEDRFTYIEGSTAAGLVVYEDKFAFSHHGTDPISGKLCNAFDLVRLHKFGLKDEDTQPDTPSNRLPSYLAMVDFASQDGPVRKQIGIEKVQSAGLDFAQDLDSEEEQNNDWLGEMEVDRKGRYETSVNNIQQILENDPFLKGKFGLNQFSNRLEVTAELPWNKIENRLWSDDDWGALRCYLGKRPYDLQRTPKLEDVMSVVKTKNAFHPIKDYLSRVIWDGQFRLETLFMVYLGAQDNPYVRAVTRKTLIAAVARIFQPGIKFEQVLTLVGKQGTGKSTIIRKLGGDWFSDTFSFHMLSGGNGIRAIEQIQGVWIVEIGEMAGLRKAEAEAAKTFISSQEDIYRPSHGRELVHRKRQNIFIGTTNNRDFLISANGNRRFWPVDIFLFEPSKNLWKELTRSEIDQIWAEAVHYYQAGESLALSEEIEALAFAEQTSHEETDEWAEIIESWLERPDPGLGGQGETLRTKVCAADIWEHALLGPAKDINNNNTKRIHNIMRKLDGWQQSKSKVHFDDRPSKQTAYYRVEKSEPLSIKWNFN